MNRMRDSSCERERPGITFRLAGARTIHDAELILAEAFRSNISQGERLAAYGRTRKVLDTNNTRSKACDIPSKHNGRILFGAREHPLTGASMADLAATVAFGLLIGGQFLGAIYSPIEQVNALP